jgi:carboxypeptidase PM20D1
MKWVSRALLELQPEVAVARGVLLGGADSRHFVSVADEVLRFAPIHVTSANMPRCDGNSERISLSNHVEMIQLYERLLRVASDRP